MPEEMRIGSTTYRKNTFGVFEVPIECLGDLRFTEVPYYSTLELANLPSDDRIQGYSLSFAATHAGGPGNDDFFVHIHVTFEESGAWDDAEAIRAVTRRTRHIQRFFHPAAGELGFSDSPTMMPPMAAGRPFFGGVLFSRNFERSTNPVLADFGFAFAKQFEAFLLAKDPFLFICHASEDTPLVQELCTFLDSRSVNLWYDRREIKVGESVVQRISDGLGAASHLVVVLSTKSAKKPWVLREFSSALMRQLQAESIVVLPLLAETCEIPTILADIRYADARVDRKGGFQELIRAL